MIKKLLTLSLIFVGALTLAACDPDTGLTTEEILEQISEAVDELELPSETSTDLTLPNTGVHDVEITWESSNEDYISDSGMVTIPTKTEGNKSVTMTATLELEDQVLTKSFSVTVIAATALNDAEKVAADALNVFIPEGETFDDVTLPTAGANGTTVTWTSSHPAVISETGVVTRPASDAANVTVTMTATITLGSESQTKTFELIVVKQVETIDIKDLKDGYDADPKTVNKGDLVVVKGVVVQTATVYNMGYFIYDGTGFLFVYTGSTVPTVTKGETVLLEGEFDNYFGQSQLKNVTSTEVLTEAIALPTPAVKTIADIIAYGTSPASALYGELIQLTGNIVYDGTEYYYIQDEDGNKLELNDDSDIAPLIALVGKNVTVTIVYQTYHSGHSNHQLSFSGDAADVVENVLSDADALTADLANLPGLFPGASITNITLPTTGLNGTVYSGWTSSDTAVFADDGTFVARALTTVTVTFTGTATKGTETQAVTVDVVVPLNLALGAAAELPAGDYVEVTGVVYYESYYGYHIAANGEFIFIKDTSYLDMIEEGDEVSVIAEIGSPYHGAAQLLSIAYVVNSQDNTLPTTMAVELGDVVNFEYPEGTLVTVTGTIVEVVGTFTDLFIEDAAGNRVQIHYNSHDYEIDDFVGQIVTADMLIYTWDYIWFNGVAADVTVVTAFTEAEEAAAVAAAVKAGLGDIDNVATDLVLPATFADPAATITWASDTEATIATDGTVVQTFGANVTVTLTATVTVGATTITKDIVVTVLDADMGTPLSVTDGLLEADGETVLITGIVSGFNYKGEPFIQDADGTAIFLDDAEDFDDTVAIGDLIVVRGELNTYTGYNNSQTNDNNQRELEDTVLVETTSTGNAVHIFTDVTPATLGVLATVGTYSSQRFTMDLTVAELDNYGYTNFTGDGTTFLKMYTSSHPYFLDLYEVGDVITMTFNVYTVNYADITLEGVILPDLTDAQKMIISEAQLDVDLELKADVVLPTTNDYGATITWATSDAAVITDAGVIARPAIGQPDGTATLTATIVVGSETAVTKDFAITVKALQPELNGGTETFTNLGLSGTSYGEGSFVGDQSVDWAYTESRGDFTLTGQAIMLDKDGDGASLSASITGGIGTLSIDFYDAYSGAAQVTVVINEGLASEVTYTSVSIDFDNGDATQVETFTVSDINITGEFTITIYSAGSQMVIDNLTWTGYSGS
jgi:hypothetical protein